jgi:hypothetical protein
MGSLSDSILWDTEWGSILWGPFCHSIRPGAEGFRAFPYWGA